MSKSCKNLANLTLFNLHLFDNVRYVFGDGYLGAHRRLAVAAADFPAANDGKPRHVGTELVVAIAQDGDFLVERVNFVVLGHETRVILNLRVSELLALLQKFLFHLLHEFLPLVDGLADVVEHGGCLLVTKEVDCSERPARYERHYYVRPVHNIIPLERLLRSEAR